MAHRHCDVGGETCWEAVDDGWTMGGRWVDGGESVRGAGEGQGSPCSCAGQYPGTAHLYTAMQRFLACASAVISSCPAGQRA